MDRLRLFVWHSALIAFVLAISVPAAAQTGATSPDGWVVLSVTEYTALKRAASPADPEPEPPPVEATLSRIDYNLKIDGDLATGEARLTVDVIKGGWVRVPLPDGLMVRDAQLDGRPVNLVSRPSERGPARLDLLLSKIGRSVLALQIVAPVTTVAGTDVLQLPVSNSAVSHATIELLKQGVNTTSDNEGRWTISGLAPGPVSVNISAPGFKRMQQDFNYDDSRPVRMGTTMESAGVTETVTVTAGVDALEKEGRRIEGMVRQNQAAVVNTPSQNVFNLQRRVAGILPVRIEVPRSGRSYNFVSPLVVDEETRITFQYKSK